MVGHGDAGLGCDEAWGRPGGEFGDLGRRSGRRRWEWGQDPPRSRRGKGSGRRGCCRGEGGCGRPVSGRGRGGRWAADWVRLRRSGIAEGFVTFGVKDREGGFVEGCGAGEDVARKVEGRGSLREGAGVDLGQHGVGVGGPCGCCKASVAALSGIMALTDPKSMIRVAREAGGDGACRALEPWASACASCAGRWAGRWRRRPTGQGLRGRRCRRSRTGRCRPTYEALKKLAGGLAISVPQLFTPPSKQQVMGRMAVTKAGEGQSHATVTYEHELLAGGLTKKQMLPYRATIRARRSGRFRRLGPARRRRVPRMC